MCDILLMAYTQNNNPFKKTTDNDRVKASNGAMVPRASLKTYEKSLAKARVASTYKQTMFNPAFGEVAATALLAPAQALRLGKKVVSYSKKINKLSKAKSKARKIDAVNDVRKIKNKSKK